MDEVEVLREEVTRLREELARLQVTCATLEPLHLMVKQVTSQVEPEEFLEEVLRQAVEIVGAEAGSLLLLDEKRGELRFAVVHGGGGESLVNKRIPADAGIAGWVVQNRQPLIVNDPTSNPRFYSGIDAQVGFTSRSIICVPLIAGGSVIGALEAVNKRQQHEFDNHDISLLWAFSSQVAMAIERKLAEDMLRRERDFVRSLVDTAPVIVLVLDGEGRVVSFNPCMEELSGYSLAEVQGKDWLLQFVPEQEVDRNRTLFLHPERLSGGETLIVPIVTRDGRKRQIEWHITSLKVPEGGGGGVLAIGQDVTERLYADRLRGALYEVSQAALDADDLEELFGFIHGIVASLMPVKEFYIALYDPEKNGFGFSYLADEHGQTISPGDYISEVSEHVLRSGRPLLANSSDLAQLTRGKSEPKSGMPCSYLGVPLRVKRGIIGVLAVQSLDEEVIYGEQELDILAFISSQVAMAIERKQAEEAAREYDAKLRQLADELARSNAELSQFAYVASHDLQEPLRTIASYVQLLARRYDGKLGPEADEYIGFVVDGAKRMQRLIDDLLSYSRVQSRAKEMKPTSSQLALARALANLQQAIGATGAVVTYDAMPTVWGDGSQLARVFQNLIGNAIKFRGHRPPRIHVSARQDGDRWVFSVRDNGIGIPREFHEQIFEVFRRLHTQTEYPGSGIGLAICKKIVERHGGRIWVESTPGDGATFFFTLQAAPHEPVREPIHEETQTCDISDTISRVQPQADKEMT